MKRTRGNRRELILKAAARLFRERGYEVTTVRDLAEAVSLQSGSLFFHFKTKEEILFSVLEDGLRRAILVLDQELSRAKTPRERLQALLRGHLRSILEEEHDAFKLILTDCRALAPESMRKIIDLRDQYESRIHQVLAELSREGLLPSDIGVLRLFLLGALNWTVQWYRADGALSVQELADRFMTLLVPLGKRPRKRESQRAAKKTIVVSIRGEGER